MKPNELKCGQSNPNGTKCPNWASNRPKWDQLGAKWIQMGSDGPSWVQNGTTWWPIGPNWAQMTVAASLAYEFYKPMHSAVCRLVNPFVFVSASACAPVSMLVPA